MKNDNIGESLLLYDNIECLKEINKRCKERINKNDVKTALLDILTFNEKLISIIGVYERILFEEFNRITEGGEEE